MDWREDTLEIKRWEPIKLVSTGFRFIGKGSRQHVCMHTFMEALTPHTLTRRTSIKELASSYKKGRRDKQYLL